MTNCFYTVIISAAFLIALSTKGVSLECYTCYSTKSWDDCLANSGFQVCENLSISNVDPAEFICQKAYSAKLVKTQQVEEFAKSCSIKDECDSEKCRKDIVPSRDASITKGSYCQVECCNEDRCNSGTTRMSDTGGLSVSFVYVMTFVAVSSMANLGTH